MQENYYDEATTVTNTGQTDSHWCDLSLAEFMFRLQKEINTFSNPYFLILITKNRVRLTSAIIKLLIW